MSAPLTLAVFTKPWKMPIPQLGEFVAGLGFAGIEFPLRPGYQVEPQEAATGLPKLVRELARYGVRVCSVAGPADEATIHACAEAGIPLIRIMANVGPEGYVAAEAQWQLKFDMLLPALERSGVTLGVQNHCDRFVANACGLRHLLAPYNPKQVAAVWDAAHEALNGMDPDLALDVIWPHLAMVNLKNGFWVRNSDPARPGWRHYWASGAQGLASWPRVVAELKKRHYQGVVCLTAEYSAEHAVNALISADLAYARSLFA
jgi:sugar phosphate isomerase/epimerase